jgi:thymidylate synthase (FAD)
MRSHQRTRRVDTLIDEHLRNPETIKHRTTDYSILSEEDRARLRKPAVILFSWTSDLERVCAAAMRSCYSSLPAFHLYTNRGKEKAQREPPLTEDRIRELIQRALKLGHESVLEHGLFTFDVQNISRASTHQLVRHRIASFSQQSQRHVKINAETDWYVIPPTLDAESQRRFEERMKIAASWYTEDSKMGRKIEDARFYLPNATKTNIVVSMNPRELLHIFVLRCGREAQWEIRAVSWAMLACSKLIAPNIFRKIPRPSPDSYVEEKESKLEEILSKLRSRFERTKPGENLEIPLAALNLESDIRALVYKL